MEADGRLTREEAWTLFVKKEMQLCEEDGEGGFLDKQGYPSTWHHSRTYLRLPSLERG